MVIAGVEVPEYFCRVSFTFFHFFHTGLNFFFVLLPMQTLATSLQKNVATSGLSKGGNYWNCTLARLVHRSST